MISFRAGQCSLILNFEWVDDGNHPHLVRALGANLQVGVPDFQGLMAPRSGWECGCGLGAACKARVLGPFSSFLPKCDQRFLRFLEGQNGADDKRFLLLCFRNTVAICNDELRCELFIKRGDSTLLVFLSDSTRTLRNRLPATLRRSAELAIWHKLLQTLKEVLHPFDDSRDWQSVVPGECAISGETEFLWKTARK